MAVVNLSEEEEQRVREQCMEIKERPADEICTVDAQHREIEEIRQSKIKGEAGEAMFGVWLEQLDLEYERTPRSESYDYEVSPPDGYEVDGTTLKIEVKARWKRDWDEHHNDLIVRTEHGITADMYVLVMVDDFLEYAHVVGWETAENVWLAPEFEYGRTESKVIRNHQMRDAERLEDELRDPTMYTEYGAQPKPHPAVKARRAEA